MLSLASYQKMLPILSDSLCKKYFLFLQVCLLFSRCWICYICGLRTGAELHRLAKYQISKFVSYDVRLIKEACKFKYRFCFDLKFWGNLIVFYIFLIFLVIISIWDLSPAPFSSLSSINFTWKQGQFQPTQNQ